MTIAITAANGQLGRYIANEAIAKLGRDNVIGIARTPSKASDLGIDIRKGDFVIVRTGHQERCLAAGDWTGYAGGDAPGLAFETAYWIKNNDIAAICADTWGCEVRPNETDEANQPWHWVVIPAIGISMGEIFYLKELAEDCEDDGVYEFFFTAPPLHIPGAAGSPINPQAIK